MRLHYHQASQRPNMTIDRPPLLMSHIDPGIGPNISTCVQKCKCHVCIEQSKNHLTLLAKQTNNSQADATSTSHVVYHRIQRHKNISNYKCNRYTHTQYHASLVTDNYKLALFCQLCFIASTVRKLYL